MIAGWLRAGIFEAGKGYSPTEEGTPQGGVISPLLLNIALHGLEEAAGVRYRTGSHAGEFKAGSPALTRYADNLVVCCHSRQDAEQVGGRLAGWLEPRGLAFNEAKTRIVPLAEGFGFLGFDLRRYPNGKLLIKPSATAIKRFRDRLAKEFRSLRGSNVAAVLAKIAPIVRGWVAYYRTVVSSRVFAALTDYLWKLTYKWACWSHPNKPKCWIIGRYFGKFEQVQERPVGVQVAWSPHPPCRNRPGPISCGTPWSKAGHHLMTPPWPGTGRNAARRSNPRWTPTPCACCPGRTGGAACAGKTCCTPTSLPSPPRAGNTGSCGSPRRRSRRTTWSTTTRPAPHAATGHTSYTPPAHRTKHPSRRAGNTVLQQMT